jgi:hypothetical protein
MNLCFTLAFILTFSPRRRNGCRVFLVVRLGIRQIQSREFSEKRRKFLLLLGEKAGMREVVKPIADWSRSSPSEIRQRQWEALAWGIISQGSPSEIRRRQ